MHPSSVRRLRRGHSPSEAACHPRKKRLYLTDRQATGGAAISALTTSLWGRGFSRLAAGRIPCPRWGQKQRLPALVAYHTPHSLSRLNFAKCPFAHHSTLTQQNMIHFVAFGLRFLILMHKNTKIAYRSKRLCIRLRSGVCGGVTAPPKPPVTPEKNGSISPTVKRPAGRPFRP